MKEKIKKIWANKWFRLFFPLILLLLLKAFEYAFDKMAGDGDGIITLPFFIKLKRLASLVAIFWFVFNVLSIGFNLGRKASAFNFAFMLLVLYIVEFMLYRKDPFPKGPFDSEYYEANYIKYHNFIDAPEGYRNSKMVTWGHPANANSQRFRDKEITQKPEGVFRIMSLGDSFTWGAGLAWNEMYTHRLDSLLKDHFKTDRIEVVNCALAGSPTIRELQILRELKDAVKPDLITVGFCANDPQPRSEDYSIEKEQFIKRWGGTLEKMQKGFSFVHLNYVGDAFVKFVYRFQYMSGKFPDPDNALGRVYDKKSKEWGMFEDAIAGIKQISDSMYCAAPVAGVFTQFGYFDCGPDFPETDKKALPIRKNRLEQVTEAFRAKKFVAINFCPIFEEETRAGTIKSSELMVNPLDGHPSAKMNRVFARELFNKIVPLITSKMDSLKKIRGSFPENKQLTDNNAQK